MVCCKCDACRSGNWRYCKDFGEIGFKRDGVYADYAVFPAYGLAEKPDNVTFEQAALCEPLGVALLANVGGLAEGSALSLRIMDYYKNFKEEFNK